MRSYELSDHLGNVHVVLSDLKKKDNNVLKSDVLAAYEYYPFGMMMQKIERESYRYGFNKMERDDEMKGGGNSYDFGARIYDPRIGRWLSMDRYVFDYPQISPYAYALNSPIIVTDPDGNTIYINGVKVKLIFEDGNLKDIKGVTKEAKALLFATWEHSQKGKDAILLMDSDKVKAYITIETKGAIFKNPSGDYASVPSTGGGRSGKDGIEEFYIDLYDLEQAFRGKITEKDLMNFVITDSEGKPIYPNKAERSKIVNDVNTNKGEKTDENQQGSFSGLTEEETKNVKVNIPNEQKVDKKIENAYTLIYEVYNAKAQVESEKSGKASDKEMATAGETAGKKAISEAYEQRKPKSKE